MESKIAVSEFPGSGLVVDSRLIAQRSRSPSKIRFTN